MSGSVKLQLWRGAKQTMDKVDVVKNLSAPLPEKPAILALGLFIHVDSIEMDTIKACYPELCSSLGVIQQPYTIKLKPGVVLFSIKNLKRITLLLVGKVKEELQHMESLGIISCIQHPTEW